MIDAKLNVLVADDDEWHRNVLKSMLESDGHAVHLARDGSEAISLYESTHPDLVLMDIVMPGIDGYEATRRIKAIAGKEFIPVTFLTSLTDESSLVKCLDVGGDDFMVKPASLAILRAKLAAVARMHKLYDDVVTQRYDLSIHHEHLRYEYEVAEKIFAKIIGPSRSSSKNIRSELMPLAVANGDLLLVAKTPAGSQYVLLGDYTGHGLAAAIGAIPITEIFNAMTRKGFGIREIIREMNCKLRATLPTGQFLAACMVEWSPHKGIVRIWNGGLPDVIMVSDKERGMTRFPSQNLPLGITSDKDFRIEIEARHVKPHNRIYLYSDGFIEARNTKGQMFGEERLEKLMLSNGDRSLLFDEIREAVMHFRDDRPQDDDVALVELLCDENPGRDEGMTGDKTDSSCGYEYSVRMNAAALKHFDTLKLVEGLFNGFAMAENHRSFLYTIITELYMNALDHGVLRVDYSVKDTADGFARYHMERERLLSGLLDGWIHIDIECLGNELSGEIILKIEDSGQGFDHDVIYGDADGNSGVNTHGRGLGLVRSLCKSLSFDGRGNFVRAVYAW